MEAGGFQEPGYRNCGLRQVVERAATGIVKAAFGGRDYRQRPWRELLSTGLRARTPALVDRRRWLQ
jgi:hypothetical protein